MPSVVVVVVGKKRGKGAGTARGLYLAGRITDYCVFFFGGSPVISYPPHSAQVFFGSFCVGKCEMFRWLKDLE